MEVTQIAPLMNTVTKEVLGDIAIQTEDLSNVVEIGQQIFDNDAVEPYVKSLVNHLGRMSFENRAYKGVAPSIMRDSWEFGSALQRVTAEMPEAVTNESWELTDGAFYNPFIFHKPNVTSKFYNGKVTFEIEMSFVEMQVKQSFSNATQLNAFLSMLENEVRKSLTIKEDELIMKTINNMIAETLHDDMPSGDYTGTGTKAINLLKLFNDRFGTTLTAEDSITNPEFIRFASYEMGVYKSRLAKPSRLFNIDGKARFTAPEQLHCVMLADFKSASDVYLQSDVYHNDLTALPNGIETVPCWQGSGMDYSFDNITKIDIKTSNKNNVSATGILAVMFDESAVMVTNLSSRVTTQYNAKAEFFNNFYKFDAGYINMFDQQMIVFYVA